VLPTPATLLRQLRDGGELSLPKQAEPSEAWVELLSRSLNLDSTLRVSLAGSAAEAWRDALIDKRVRAARLELGDAEVSGLQVSVLR
jgi:protein-L-isoaspartate O-methyltransferase